MTMKTTAAAAAAKQRKNYNEFLFTRYYVGNEMKNMRRVGITKGEWNNMCKLVNVNE